MYKTINCCTRIRNNRKTGNMAVNQTKDNWIKDRQQKQNIETENRAEYNAKNNMETAIEKEDGYKS